MICLFLVGCYGALQHSTGHIVPKDKFESMNYVENKSYERHNCLNVNFELMLSFGHLIEDDNVVLALAGGDKWRQAGIAVVKF